MTKEELIALRRERGKQELNIGDRVKVYDRDDGEVLYGGRTFEITGKGKCNGEFIYSLHGLMSPFTAEILELVKEPTDEIKCGDIVKVKRETPKDLYNNLPYSFVDMPFFVAEIERDCDNPMYDTSLLRNGSTCLNIHPRWLERWDAKPQPNDHTIAIPVKADLDDIYWDVYRAELAKEFALKIINANNICCLQNADHITDFVTRIVNNLKKQSE